MPTLIKNGKNYSGTSVSLTQAEYDALTETQKNDGTVYFITDSNAVLDASDVSVGSGTVEDSIGSIALIETSPATSAHAVGTYLVYNGKLYKVTSAISASEQLVVGTNIVATTVGDEMSNGIKLLWENSSPSSAFGAQTLTLSTLANYKLVMIIFRMKASAGTPYLCSDLACVDGGSYVASCPNWDTNTNIPRARNYVVRTSGSITFTNGAKYTTYGTPTDDGDSMVPIAIYGIY